MQCRLADDPAMPRIFLLFIPLLFLACSDRGLSPGEGFIDVPGGRVWYQVVGHGSATPLLLVHGGPGWPSDYLQPLRRVAADRPVIFYDQLGAGRSDRNMNESLWRMKRFIDELAAVRKSLELDEVHILGHSWGSMLAVDYLQTNPAGVESLILASPVMSATRWAEDAQDLIKKLPFDSRYAIETHQATGTTSDPAYQAAKQEYYEWYLSRLDPWPARLLDTFGRTNSRLRTHMWGGSEFELTGTLRDYEREAYLPELDLPVLVTAGRHDAVTPETAQHYRDLVPGAKLAIFENSAHMTMLDEPDASADAIRDFLNEVDRQK
jgi:proline iminopeptidase